MNRYSISGSKYNIKTVDIFKRKPKGVIKETIKEYHDSKEPQLILDGLNKYINELIPKLSEFKKLKYDYYDVEKDEHTNEFKLVKTGVSTTFLENILDNKPPTINSFVQ